MKPMNASNLPRYRTKDKVSKWNKDYVKNTSCFRVSADAKSRIVELTTSLGQKFDVKGVGAADILHLFVWHLADSGKSKFNPKKLISVLATVTPFTNVGIAPLKRVTFLNDAFQAYVEMAKPLINHYQDEIISVNDASSYLFTAVADYISSGRIADNDIQLFLERYSSDKNFKFSKDYFK